MANRPSLLRKTLVSGALVVGVGAGAAGIASAATSSSSSGSSSVSQGSSGTSSSPRVPGVPPAGSPGDPAVMPHGPGETPLTGTTLQRAEAAAKAAVPGATVIRAETDSSGSAAYEVHMKKSDGTFVTVELNSNFSVVKTVTGFCDGPGAMPGGPMPGGAHLPGGPRPDATPGQTGGSATSGAGTRAA